MNAPIAERCVEQGAGISPVRRLRPVQWYPTTPAAAEPIYAGSE